MHTIGGFDVRRQVLGIVAQHLKPLAFFKSATPVGDGAFRRLAQKVELELLARVAEVGLSRPDGDVRLQWDGWFLERARELGVQHEPPDADCSRDGTCSSSEFDPVQEWALFSARSTSANSTAA